MSRIGKIPIELKVGISASLKGGVLSVSGKKGELNFKIPKNIDVKVGNGKIIVSTDKKDELIKPLFGLTRATIANMVKGVDALFEKKLELVGVGFRAQVSGNELVLSLGYSHPVKIQAPLGIAFGVSENVISVSGVDKALVGDVSARIRAIRKPEPYKGKGIRYVGERIRKKAGKAAKAVGAVK